MKQLSVLEFTDFVSAWDLMEGSTIRLRKEIQKDIDNDIKRIW